MMARLHGFSQIDATNFTSSDKKTHLQLFLNENPCIMKFTIEGYNYYQ